jgi:hypothetical protein
MYPPADPWGDPTEPTPMYGRASVPVPQPREPTAEFPPVLRTPARSPVEVSWEKVKNPARRRLSDGWGFTAAGLIAIVSGWVIWASGSRETGISIWPGFLFALLVAGLIFATARLVGYVFLERVMGRVRRHARWSHFLAGLFLTVVGAWYVVNTNVDLSSGGDWLQDGWQWLKDLVDRG